jgi:hypothetical protein
MCKNCFHNCTSIHLISSIPLSQEGIIPPLVACSHLHLLILVDPHAGMAAASDAACEALRAAQLDNAETSGSGDTAASARAAARAFDHFYADSLQGPDTLVPSGILEGYTVWRPRLRNGGNCASNSAGPLPALGDFKSSCWDLAAIERAAAMLSPASSVTSESDLDLGAPLGSTQGDSDDSDDLTTRDGPGLRDQLTSGMEGDIMHAAAASVFQPETSTAPTLPYIQSLRQRLLAANTAHTVTAAGAAGVQHEGKRPSESSSSSGSRPQTLKPDVRDENGHSCPVHWFVADDESSKIRYISLQVRF